MGGFGAVFGCSGDVGFSGPLLGVSSGVVGFNVAALSRLVCEKVRPAWSDGGREREIVRPARSKWPKFGVFALAGRVSSRQSRWRGCAGRVISRQPVLWPGLVGDAVHFRRLRWGFYAMRSLLAACRRRVGALDGVISPDWWRSTRSLWWCRGQTADPLGKRVQKLLVWLNGSAIWWNRSLSWRIVRA